MPCKVMPCWLTNKVLKWRQDSEGQENCHVLLFVLVEAGDGLLCRMRLQAINLGRQWREWGGWKVKDREKGKAFGDPYGTVERGFSMKQPNQWPKPHSQGRRRIRKVQKSTMHKNEGGKHECQAPPPQIQQIHIDWRDVKQGCGRCRLTSTHSPLSFKSDLWLLKASGRATLQLCYNDTLQVTHTCGIQKYSTVYVHTPAYVGAKSVTAVRNSFGGGHS